MPSLLLRDWKLYRLTLILPLGFCLLWAFIPYMILSHETRPIAFPVAFVALAPAPLMAALRVLGLHLMELKHGTLSDLFALPVTRTQIVILRVVEGLLLTALLLAAVLVEGAIIRSVSNASNPLLPADLFGTFLGLGWLLVATLLLPLPILLRWGSTGMVVSVIGGLVILESARFLPKEALSSSLAALRPMPLESWSQVPLLLFVAALLMGVSVRVLQRLEV